MKAIPPILAATAIGLFIVRVDGQSSVVPAASDLSNQPARQEPPPADPTSSADQLLQRAIVAAKRHQTVATGIRHRAEFFGRRVTGTGSYLQAGQGNQQRLRLELKIPVAGQLSTRLEVCDGQYLWINRASGDNSELEQVDVRRIRCMLEPADPNGRSKLARPAASPSPPGGKLAIGGLPMLLESLRGAFQFTTVPDEAGSPAAATWTLRGEWKPRHVAHMFSGRDGGPPSDRTADASRLPEYLPDHVLVVLGRDDLFPHRVEYRRRAAAGGTSGEGRSRTLVTIEWFGVRLNEPIDPAAFVYDPGLINRSDGTQRYLRRFGLEAGQE